jgi:small-conductance mechanosensitive channel
MTIVEWIEQTLHIPPIEQKKIVLSLVVLIVLSVLRRIIIKFAIPKNKDIKTIYTWRKIANYILSSLSLIIIGLIWLQEIQSFSTFFGLLTAGLAIALREPVVNFFGWLYIIFRAPFEMGDRIEIKNIAGDVLGISTLEFTLMEIGNWVDADQSTGRIIHVPNGFVFNSAIHNYTQAFGHIWHEIPVLITFESDWRKAKDLLLDLEKRVIREFGLQQTASLSKVNQNISLKFSILTPAIYTSVEASGVLLTIRYLCDPRKRRGSQQIIWEEILTMFAEHDDIEFAYPTTAMRYSKEKLAGIRKDDINTKNKE